MTRIYGEEEMIRMMKEIMENNATMLELQKQIGELQVEEKKRRQKDREIERRRQKEKENNRWRRESYERNEREREKREEQRRIDKEWRNIEKMKRKEEKRAEKEWRNQEIRERRRKERGQIAMEKRKCFVCGGFRHMAYSCRNVGEEEPIQVPSNKFEVLKNRVMQKEEGSGKEIIKDRREILKEEKAKRGVEVRQTKIKRKEKKEKKEKMLREVVVKIELKQEEEEEGVVTEALLDSGAMGLVMSEEFVRRHKFRRTKLERSVYVRNVDSTLNYAGQIIDTVEVEIFFKGHKEQMSIDVIGG